jgi:hypothetical protein
VSEKAASHVHPRHHGNEEALSPDCRGLVLLGGKVFLDSKQLFVVIDPVVNAYCRRIPRYTLQIGVGGSESRVAGVA